MIVGSWNHQFTHVPTAAAVVRRKRVDPEGRLWASVLASTGQPAEMK
jgi:6-phosphofructokinase 1